VQGRFAKLVRRGRAELQREGFDGNRARASLRLDLRYQGQSYELPVPFGADFRLRFQQEHVKAYGYAYPERQVEIVNLRVRLAISTPQAPTRKRRPGPAAQSREALIKTKAVWFDSKALPTGFYARERLAPGAALRGPAVIVEYSATTVVPPDFTCLVDEHENLVLERQA